MRPLLRRQTVAKGSDTLHDLVPVIEDLEVHQRITLTLNEPLATQQMLNEECLNPALHRITEPIPVNPEVYQLAALMPGDPGVQRGIDLDLDLGDLGRPRVDQIYTITGALETGPAIDQDRDSIEVCETQLKLHTIKGLRDQGLDVDSLAEPQDRIQAKYNLSPN